MDNDPKSQRPPVRSWGPLRPADFVIDTTEQDRAAWHDAAVIAVIAIVAMALMVLA